jgi:hypothetical protein
MTDKYLAIVQLNISTVSVHNICWRACSEKSEYSESSKYSESSDLKNRGSSKDSEYSKNSENSEFVWHDFMETLVVKRLRYRVTIWNIAKKYSTRAVT